MSRRMRFSTWCKKDVNDERKINYTFETVDEGVKKFTSEDTCTYSDIVRLREAWVRDIRLIDNEWYADLYED